MKELKMTQHKDEAGKKRRLRFISSLFAIILMLGCIMIPDTNAQASSLSVGVSASSVKIGDTVTVSITVPAGVSATVNVTYPSGTFSFSSASDTASANGGTVSMTIGSYGSSNTKTTGTMKFKAKAAGSATFSASAPIAGNQDGDRVSVGGASASVRVKNEANENNSNKSDSSNGSDTSDNNSDDNKTKSADNSLASLTLSSGSLSPAFKYNVTNYTAEVANDVTSVVVSAKTSNANATVESVKGGENLSVGANKIQIVVKAENGVTATYTITVTRKESGDNTDEPEPDNTDEPQEQCYDIGGVKMYPSEDGDESQIPEEFALSEITLWEKAYPYWVNDTIGSDVGLIYLVDENQENGAWYRISEASPYEAKPFICFKSEYGYIIATPEKMNETAPAGYTSETINIEGKGVADAFVKAGDEENCLIYAVNQDGVYGLYQYDLQDRTYMRYKEAPVAEDTQVTEEPTIEDSTKVSDLESQNRLLFYAFIVVVAILLIVIVILVVKRRHDGDDYADDDDYEEEDEEEEEEEDTDSASNDVGYRMDELDLSDERAGASKRYDRSAFLTGDEVTAEDAEPDETAEEQTESDVEAETEEEQNNIEVEPESEITDEESIGTENPIVSEAAVNETETSEVTTNTVDLEAVLAQAVAETMDERADGKGQSAEESEETLSSEEDDAAVQEEIEEERPRRDKHKKKSYREKIRESMDDFEDEDEFGFEDDEEDYDDEPKKSRKEKKEKHGFFGRKKKNDEDEDDDIEFLDL